MKHTKFNDAANAILNRLNEALTVSPVPNANKPVTGSATAAAPSLSADDLKDPAVKAAVLKKRQAEQANNAKQIAAINAVK